MGTYLTPDLTGENQLYKSGNNAHVVFQTDQRIEFNKSVFANSINVILPESHNTPLIYRVDWDIKPEDIDYNAISQCKVKDPSFDKQLVKSITIVKPIASQIKINVSFQMLYPLHSTKALYNSEPLEFTPNDWLEILQTLKYHEMLLSPIKDMTSVESKIPRLLEIDPDMNRPENFVQGEMHEMDVPNNIQFIHPICGAFFSNTLKIKDVSTNTDMVLGRDYDIFALDVHRTKMAGDVNKSGVYNFILIKKPIIGFVKIDYHAFGGDVTLYDQRVIEDNIQNVIAFLNNSKFLTPESIGGTDIVRQLVQRTTKLEEDMRLLCSTGRPNYGDIKNNVNLLMKITSPDTDYHWWNIASLYKVDGSEDIVTADRMHLRIHALQSGMMFDAMFAVNLNNKVNKFDIDILSDIYPKFFDSLNSYDIDNIVYPQFRVVWNENMTQESGIYLQIGLALKNIAVETLAIENLSGIESCWKLVPSVVTEVGSEDIIFSLPSTNHTWSNVHPDSKAEGMMIPFTEGHLIWAGSQSLNRPLAGRKSFTIDHYLPKDIDISKFKKLRLELFEKGHSKFPVTMEFIPGTENLVGTAPAFAYQGKPSYITGNIYRDPQGEIVISFTVDIEAGLSSNQLDLCHVIVFT